MEHSFRRQLHSRSDLQTDNRMCISCIHPTFCETCIPSVNLGNKRRISIWRSLRSMARCAASSLTGSVRSRRTCDWPSAHFIIPLIYWTTFYLNSSDFAIIRTWSRTLLCYRVLHVCLYPPKTTKWIRRCQVLRNFSDSFLDTSHLLQKNSMSNNNIYNKWAPWTEDRRTRSSTPKRMNYARRSTIFWI